MKKIFLILASLLLVSCHEEHKIEIYLLKERVPNKRGVPVMKVKEFREGLEAHPDDAFNYEFATFDTIAKEIVFADAFDAPPKDKWQKDPLIIDDEILLLDTLNSKLRISNSGLHKIVSLKHDFRKGHQFVITDNGKPVMTGYFWNRFSSLESNAENILYTNSIDSTKKHYDFDLVRTNWQPSYFKKTDFNKYPQLIAAFKESSRLKD